MDKKVLEAIKAEMGYSDGTDCCKACEHFVPTDCSGRHNALPTHCRRNAFIVPVSETGRCKHWTEKA